MNRRNLITALTLLALCIGAWSSLAQGPLPGDVSATNATQMLLGRQPGWAAFLTETAKAPLVIASLIVAAGLAGHLGGWRCAAAAPLAYGLALLSDRALRAVLFVPRPDPELVAVASASSSSGLPSTFGLVYGALFGVVFFVGGWRRTARAVRMAAAALILAGASARIVLGGHWPSQMLASIALGIVLSGAAVAIVQVAAARLQGIGRGR